MPNVNQGDEANGRVLALRSPTVKPPSRYSKTDPSHKAAWPFAIIQSLCGHRGPGPAAAESPVHCLNIRLKPHTHSGETVRNRARRPVMPKLRASAILKLTLLGLLIALAIGFTRFTET